MNKRVFVTRRIGFDIEKKDLIEVISSNFNIELSSLNYYIGYDVFNVESSLMNKVITEVFAEKNRDIVIEELPTSRNVISYEFLPGQFDQRADSAEQCIKLIDSTSQPIVKSSIIITYDELISDVLTLKIKKYLINAVESREKNLDVLELPIIAEPESVPVIIGFNDFSESELRTFYSEYSLAMSFHDLLFIQSYFIETERRNPFETELRVLDTYWSDHCRHTTFETEIQDIEFNHSIISRKIQESYNDYIISKEKLGRKTKPNTLMDIATINARIEKTSGNLADLEISEEINAASIFIDVDVDGVDEKWLLMFKNETHNHPTEIEPFGGASTCIGGAIRDPLSGRSYVYSAMRITGAADITEDISRTIKGKLPQSLISKNAAKGYASYGNQIGLATTFVDEIYHDGYKAKRMEIGAVVGAVKASHVRRESPTPGDVVLLLGGKTGRDGIGGATGSSKEHTVESLDVSSAEVQKGNAPEERKIQRLFRNPKVTKLIKKSNDFGAGGVCVAIGELADGISINLDKIPTKYKGINGTELAISESQERMAVVVEVKDKEDFMHHCRKENIEVVEVAQITETPRLVMVWRDKIICNMSREFIDTSGIRQSIGIKLPKTEVTDFYRRDYPGNNTKEKTLNMLMDKNISSKQGLVEMFDSSIGRTTVLSPFGGKYMTSKTQASIHKLPVQNGSTKTVSMMTYGFNPYISEWSPYHGSTYAIIESMAKIVSSGGDYKNIRFTFQEYFERLNRDPLLWSKPFSALMGAYNTLKEFNLAAIGGKDSMSGTYHDLTVPPTLVSFAVSTGDVDNVISPEFKNSNSYIYVLHHTVEKDMLPNFEEVKRNFTYVTKNILNKNIISAYSMTYGGLSEALIKMSYGNRIGFEVKTSMNLFDIDYGSIVVESSCELNYDNAIFLGKTDDSRFIKINDMKLHIDEALEVNQSKYRKLYPIVHNEVDKVINMIPDKKVDSLVKNNFDYVSEVKVLIPVFPGTNCEYDCEAAFKKEGAKVNVLVFNNSNEDEINESLKELATEIDNSHILMLAGGFSSGDEPDGSGKFIASVLKNKIVMEAIERFLGKKHLILGICNGFQALVKSGLLPYGKVKVIEEGDPTLFKNSINRHIAKFVKTKVAPNSSPWLSSFIGTDVHTIAMSHGEGKFMISEEDYNALVEKNQIAFQYVDERDEPTYNPLYNPNGSSYAIEGITSIDGLILGKMGHSERYTEDLFKNIKGNKDQNIFKNGVQYFKDGSIN